MHARQVLYQLSPTPALMVAVRSIVSHLLCVHTKHLMVSSLVLFMTLRVSMWALVPPSMYVEVRRQYSESQFSPSTVGSCDRKKQELLPRKHLGSHILYYIEARAFNPKKHLGSNI